MVNRTKFRKEIESMKKGERIYIDALGLSINSIDLLRTYIQASVLIPDVEWLKAQIKEEHIWKFEIGSSICPQMEYVKGI